MRNYVNFDGYLMKSLVHGLINQIVLPLNDATRNISVGDVLGISFDNIRFADYSMLIEKISFTNLNKLTNKDINNNGFIYKPTFLKYMNETFGLENGDSVVKIQFKLMENDL